MLNSNSTDSPYKQAKFSDASLAIRVLTPQVDKADNQYLNSLWSSVESYGVKVSEFELTHLVAQVKANRKVGNVIHLNWINRFCICHDNSVLKSIKKVRALYYTLRNLYYFIFIKSKGYQLVWTVHNTISHDSKTGIIERLFRWQLSCLCSDIIVMSEYSRQEFSRKYRRTKRVHVVPHGNYIGAYPNDVSQAEARKQLGISPHQKVLLHFGYIRPYKGISNLLATFAQLKEPDLVLIIAGRCSCSALFSEIEQAAHIDSRIHLRLDFIPDQEIQWYMNACNWVVLPYNKILNSGSVLLALSFGRPVIVPQQGSLTELIQNGREGFFYLQDYDLITTLNHALITSSQQWQQMCTQAYALAQQYDWSKIGAKLYQIYQQDS